MLSLIPQAYQVHPNPQAPTLPLHCRMKNYVVSLTELQGEDHRYAVIPPYGPRSGHWARNASGGGRILVSVNPYKLLNVYGTDMVHQYEGHGLSDNPP
ncbi:hypothetical protein GOODEAATRI_008635 [Goodea atripinnis]|uniref:Uncharacterized protein n=1 Tax=Goodea atripinnis TaxID=208336 RepID=A0ABV0MH61_9TELE